MTPAISYSEEADKQKKGRTIEKKSHERELIGFHSWKDSAIYNRYHSLKLGYANLLLLQ